MAKLAIRGWLPWLALGCVVALALLAGWNLFWFLTDDAHIAFRYVSNSRMGYGYVWNAPPFLPVEGYTSFLWIVILDAVWRGLGVDPPHASNVISLLFSGGSLLLTALLVQRIRLEGPRSNLHFWAAALVILACLTNRTFLAWTSSGLETAMFNFFALGWVFSYMASLSRGVVPRIWPAIMASLLYLTRPDGMLFGLVTLSLLLIWACADRSHPLGKRLLPFLPFGLIVGHLLWRHGFYGEWVPNTYVAKYVSPWPESGLRYALSFILEYGLWVWLAILIAYLVRMTRRGKSTPTLTERLTERFRTALGDIGHTGVSTLMLIAVPATVLTHLLYYTLIIGGDHFEYRVYSYTIPLIFVSGIWLINSLHTSRALALGLFLALLLAGYPLPWTHWARTRELTERIVALRVPVADALPPILRWYGRTFDRLQFWLIEHAVCMRHQEHKAYWIHQTKRYPSRKEGLSVSPNNFPVLAVGTTGMPSWVFPHVNIIDTLGLNDYVVARNPVRPESHGGRRVIGSYVVPDRLMAHQRRAPRGYVDAYRPNVRIFDAGRFAIIPRRPQMDEAYIRSTEHEWRKRIQEAQESYRKERLSSE